MNLKSFNPDNKSANLFLIADSASSELKEFKISTL